MNTPLVSIISPTYNHEKYISDCINSVLSQSYEHWEMIIVDDGSTDKTLNIARRFAEQDHRIKVFTQNNIGIFRLAETYNFALKQSQGKYIAVLECDDVWTKDKLALQVEKMESTPDIVLSWGKAYASKVDLSSNYFISPDNNNNIDNYYNNTPVGSSLNEFIFRNFIPALTVIVKKDALLAIGGFKQKYNLPLVDLPTWEELALKGTFAFINEPLGHWRIYSTQVTKTYTTDIYEGFYLLALELYQQQTPFIHISLKEIKQYYRRQLIIAYSRSGRYKLIRKDFKGARKDYYRSIFHFGAHAIMWKIRSIVGLIFSFFHADVEKLAQILGKDSYS